MTGAHACGTGAVEVFDIQGVAQRKEKTPRELVEDDWKRSEAMVGFMSGMLKELSEENRKQGGDGNVTGIVVG